MNDQHLLAVAFDVYQKLSRPQVKSIAAAATGLIEAQVVGIAALGRSMPGKAQPRSRAKRVERSWWPESHAPPRTCQSRNSSMVQM